jgi:hypothetical protein
LATKENGVMLTSKQATFWSTLQMGLTAVMMASSAAGREWCYTVIDRQTSPGSCVVADWSVINIVLFTAFFFLRPPLRVVLSLSLSHTCTHQT